MARPKTQKKKEKKNVLTGVVHIQSTFNNTIVTSTDTQGNGHQQVVADSKAQERVLLLQLNLQQNQLPRNH